MPQVDITSISRHRRVQPTPAAIHTKSQTRIVTSHTLLGTSSFIRLCVVHTVTPPRLSFPLPPDHLVGTRVYKVSLQRKNTMVWLFVSGSWASLASFFCLLFFSLFGFDLLSFPPLGLPSVDSLPYVVQCTSIELRSRVLVPFQPLPRHFSEGWLFRRPFLVLREKPRRPSSSWVLSLLPRE